MTPEQLRQTVLQAGILDADELEISRASLVFCKGFRTYDDEDPHDIAWQTLLSLQQGLNTVGLHAVNTDSDNDSVWGEIEEKGREEG